MKQDEKRSRKGALFLVKVLDYYSSVEGVKVICNYPLRSFVPFAFLPASLQAGGKGIGQVITYVLNSIQDRFVYWDMFIQTYRTINILMKISFTTLALTISLCVTQIQVSAQTATVKVEGEVLTPLTLSVDDLSKMTIVKLKAKERDGKEHEYAGVTLYDVLKKAGVTLGPELKGENMAKLVLVKAADNYEVVYALAEIDPEFTNDRVILAYQVDGSPLPKGQGPFRLVTPGDKKHARWIREITTIKVLFAKE